MQAKGPLAYVEVRLDSARLGVPLDQVDRVVRAVALAPVPGGSDCLLGLADVHGTAVPVYDTRRLLGLPSRPLQLSDRILLTRADAVRGFLVDDVLGTVWTDAAQHPGSFALESSGVRGVVRQEGGFMLLQDLRRFMALERAVPVHAHG